MRSKYNPRNENIVPTSWTVLSKSTKYEFSAKDLPHTYSRLIPGEVGIRGSRIWLAKTSDRTLVPGRAGHEKHWTADIRALRVVPSAPPARSAASWQQREPVVGGGWPERSTVPMFPGRTGGSVPNPQRGRREPDSDQGSMNTLAR